LRCGSDFASGSDLQIFKTTTIQYQTFCPEQSRIQNLLRGNVARTSFYNLCRDGAEKVDYASCLALLLNSGNSAALTPIINKQDLLGNTPLHYAVQFWSQEIVTQLLLLGIGFFLPLREGFGKKR
jgi:GAF domain-containing protein